MLRQDIDNAYESALRDRNAYESALRDRNAYESALRDRNAYESALRDRSAYESALRDRDAYESALRDRNAYESALRDRSAYESALRDRNAYESALRDRNAVSVSTLRMVMSTLKDKDIEARPKGATAIPDDRILSMLQSMIEQRRESIALHRQGDRGDPVAKETAEIAAIERFLPQPMDAAIEAVSIKDMGKAMAELKARRAGAMDFQAASTVVKARLQG